MEPWLESLLRSMGEGEDGMTDKQIRIIGAAVGAFADKGFAAASTSEIAQKAGVAEGTIFRHYKTKKDLLLAIVRPIMSRIAAPFLLRDFQKVLDVEYEQFEDFLRAIFRNRLEFAIRNAPVLKIMLHEIPFHPELQAQFQREVVPLVSGRVQEIVTRFQARGQLVDMPPLTLIRMCVTNLAGYVLLRTIVMPDAEWDDEVEMERIISLIMNGIGKGKRVD